MIDRAIAIHEAGHAVAAYALGEKFVRISTQEHETSAGFDLLGHVAFDMAWFDPNKPLTDGERQRLEHFTMIMMAGKYTEECWRKRTYTTPVDPRLLECKAAVDDLHCLRFTMALAVRTDKYNGTPSEIENMLRVRLANWVSSTEEVYWRLASALSDAVMGGATLSWEQARKVLRRAECNSAISSMKGSWLSKLS